MKKDFWKKLTSVEEEITCEIKKMLLAKNGYINIPYYYNYNSEINEDLYEHSDIYDLRLREGSGYNTNVTFNLNFDEIYNVDIVRISLNNDGDINITTSEHETFNYLDLNSIEEYVFLYDKLYDIVNA